ncbi:hypothetical protein DFP72DRAFT_830309 [Ephemerocybe angulata]|uniref:Uncharacterized protein n=1 Tax=Ephemerocybe angulata TaxID=980116 RepID=A0A8H6H9X9_9AGAR|nr:hypothetical protein DFP72DRAFT_830309 [Tulosesus angulatus]
MLTDYLKHKLAHNLLHIDHLPCSSALLPRRQPRPSWELSRYNFTERNLDQDITLGSWYPPPLRHKGPQAMKTCDIITLYKHIYCKIFLSNILDIPSNKEQCDWIQRIEVTKSLNYTINQKHMKPSFPA